MTFSAIFTTMCGTACATPRHHNGKRHYMMATRLSVGRFPTHAHRLPALPWPSHPGSSTRLHLARHCTRAPTPSLLKGIEATTLADVMAQAEWFIEGRLKFRPPARSERNAG